MSLIWKRSEKRDRGTTIQRTKNDFTEWYVNVHSLAMVTSILSELMMETDSDVTNNDNDMTTITTTI